MKVKKGDSVKIISGKDKGKIGEVLSAFPQTSKILVKGVNVVIKNRKKRRDEVAGGRVSIELPIHVSNVLVVNPESGVASRVGYEVKDGKKTRVFKKVVVKTKKVMNEAKVTKSTKDKVAK